MNLLSRSHPTFRILLTVVFMLSLMAIPQPVGAEQTITVAPTQPIYLINNGDTAEVGFRMTFTGTPAEGLDRDISLTLTTGAALQVGSAPGNAQNVATTLAGSTTVAAATSTLALGKGRTSAAAAAGATNIKVNSVTNILVGDSLNVDTGSNLETVTVTEVGTTGSTGTGITFTPALAKAHSSNRTYAAVAPAGSTTIRVASVTDFSAGLEIQIDSGANAETATIAEVQAADNLLVLASPLTRSHAVISWNAPDLPLASITPSGTTNIKVAEVAGFTAGQAINIDTGSSLETANIANVGTPGFGGTGLELTAGLLYSHVGAVAVVPMDPVALAGGTNVKVNNVMGYYPGDWITIDTGANVETRTIVAVGTAGIQGSGIELDSPLTLSHSAGAAVTDTRVLQSTAALGTDYTVASNTVVIPAGSPSGTVVTISIATLPNPIPSVALTINTTLACTDGCTGVTVNNNDPSTVVINAHGFPYLDPSLSVAERVSDLMSRMSLFDKVGQMTQTNMTVLRGSSTTDNASWNGVRAWRLGSILSGGTDSPTPNSPTGWADLIDAFEYRALATPLQIPLIYGIDTIHGNSHMIGAVLFPHDIGMGAAHNPELSYQQGVITAQETRSTGPHWGFGPTICAARDIRWGRTYECYSEDPDHVNLMETIIEGYQGPNPLDMSGVHIVASAKHFAGDGATLNGVNTGVNVMSYEEFARVALAPYVPAVQKYHTGTIMPSYSSTQLDGATTSIKMSANADLMTGWLKEDHGFEGFLISDYNAIDQIPVASPNPLPAPINNSYAYQAMISFNAGMDMVMAPNNPAWKNFINYVQTLVKTGYMSQSRIDDAVRRILMQKFALGLFEQPFTDRPSQEQILSAEHRAVAREATAESQVLLKNVDNILPLSKTAKIYLAGSNAHSVINQAGGWSISWQSIPTGDVPAVDTYFTTIREAVQNVVGTDNVTYSATASPAPAAGIYAVGIVVVGETAYAEGSGDVPSAKTNRTTTADATAINNVCSVMPCIIMTVAGRPFWLTDAQFDAAHAVVASWIGSSEGDGIADVLFGDKDFTGRLPMTWSRDVSQEPINVGDSDYNPRYPYGWGLRTGSSKARLQATRGALAGVSGDAHLAAAVAYLDQLLAADVWDDGGAASNAGYALRLLHQAAGELAQTPAETFLQYDGVVSAARDIAQAAVVAAGGPSVATSALFADANHEVMIDHPDVAVELLARAVPPVVSADPAAQTVQYTDRVQAITISAENAASELPLAASTQWSLDGGAFQPGLPDWLVWTESGCTADGIWGGCGWSMAGVGTVQVPGGAYLVRTTVTEGAQSSVVDVMIVVDQEDAFVQYTGESIKEIGKELALRATVWDSAAAGYAGSNPESGPDATLGDLSKIWIKFALSDCDSGAPIIDLYAQAGDTGDAGDGIGTASDSYMSAQEGLICANASVVAGPEGGANQWYVADSADSVLTFYEPSGQFVTGGGWVADPSGGKGHFGFTARYLKNGRAQGNLVYTYGGEYNGEVVEYKIKSGTVNALAFGGNTFPVSASLQGKAVFNIIRSSDGATLYSDGNATFLATAVDGDANAADTFALAVYDKRGVEIKNVPESLLQGGNVLAHP